MIVAYADPPYPGRAHYYRDHPDFAGEVDHVDLINRLVDDYDAFALHTSSTALRELLRLCPPETRVLAWCKSWASWKPGVSPAFAWEPVLIHGHRPRGEGDKVRDFYVCRAAHDRWEYPGSKPADLVVWVFAALGLEPDDQLDDLFPGSGVVGRTWDAYRTQTRIDLRDADVDQLGVDDEFAHGLGELDGGGP